MELEIDAVKSAIRAKVIALANDLGEDASDISDDDIIPATGALDSAAILIGRDPSYILSLGIRHHGSEDDLLVLLETIRAAIGLKLREQAYVNQLKQAQAIQHSLLPSTLPTLSGYEIAVVSHPATEVGGDVFDVQEVEEGVLGLMLADASGHGLPAALQARDVVIGDVGGIGHGLSPRCRGGESLLCRPGVGCLI